MNYTVNGCEVFLPQRVISIEDKTVSGVFLGLDEVVTIKISDNSTFSAVLEAQSESKLSSNTAENTSVVLFINDNGLFSVFSDKTKKVLFCQSFTTNDSVYLVKIGLKKEFGLKSLSEFKAYAKKHIVKGNSSQEMVEIERDDFVSICSEHQQVESVENFFLASVTPLVRFNHNLVMGISNRGYSMVILDIKQNLLCVARHDVLKPQPEKKQGATIKSEKLGLARYYDSFKNNNKS